MKFCRVLSSVALFLAVSPSFAAEFKFAERTLVVPDGFEIEQVAGPPLVERPIAVARDEQGRLYVTDSAGMSDRADKQIVTKPHRIRRLEDTNGDGRYDTSILFAEGLMFPEGCLWYEGSLYVAAPPQILKLTDEDGDGRAERREVWYDGKTLTGCANDLHGPYMGHDGWIYWCKGAFAEQQHTLPNGKPFVTRSSHIFRARPDGSLMEPVLTGGMDNPVNVAITSTGERILSCTFFQHPEAGRRDGLIHAIYGGVYGKKHESIYFHKMTGDVMPVLVHEGAAAPCGLAAGSEAIFGGGYTDQLFACYFNLHKVVRHELVPNGPTYRTVDTDLVSCEHPDFHPTDVFENADGSLLVVDTGGWYKMCCPTSQLAKPDVLGAVYRLRKKGQAKVEDPLGAKIAWKSLDNAELAQLLGDSRLFVQRRATSELRKHGEAAVAALADVASNHTEAATRRRAVWALSGIDAPTARQATRRTLRDKDPSVVHVATHVAGLWRDSSALYDLLKIVAGNDAMLQRVAAEAVGRIADPATVPALLKAIEKLGPMTAGSSGAPADDAQRVREHGLIYALIEIADPASVAAGLTSSNPQVQRAALVALDQMDGGGLRPDQVVPLLDRPEPMLKQTAAWIVGHRAEWGSVLVDYFRARLAKPLSADESKELAAQLAQLGKSTAIQELLVATLHDTPRDDVRLVALQAMADAGLTATPPAWLDEVAKQLPAAQGPVLTQVVAVARQLPQPKGGHAATRDALLAVGHRADAPVQTRLDALLAVGNLSQVEPDLFAVLLKSVLPDESLELRGAAAGVLGKATLTADQQKVLLEAVAEIGPLELPKLLPAFERGPNEAFGLKLVAALSESAGLRGLRVDLVKPLLAKYPPSVQEAGQKLIALLNASAADQAAHLDRLTKELPAGDIRRGHAVFLNKKIACSTCHTIGYLGGKLGPDLTNIGKVRTERDLLESIIYPSASFVRSYEPVLVVLDDGRTANGIIVKDTASEVMIATAPQQFQHFVRSDIVELHPGTVSLMPQGIDKILNPQEIADLIAFLKNAPK